MCCARAHERRDAQREARPERQRQVKRGTHNKVRIAAMRTASVPTLDTPRQVNTVPP